MFYRYLDKCETYFEFGSGRSTYQAINRKNIKKIYSVESDIVWYQKMKNIINDNIVADLHLVDLKSAVNTYGRLGKSSDKNDWIKYTNFIVDIGIDESKNRFYTN